MESWGRTDPGTAKEYGTQACDASGRDGALSWIAWLAGSGW